jgi:fermentation-respiration switch protein FrsA (DUF1100 family)
MDRAICYLLIAFLCSHACGCAALGPLSPLRPLERSLVFSPSRTPPDQKEKPGDVPDVWFQSDDGIRLHGQCFDHPKPRAIALFCHGNAGSVETWSQVGRYLKQRHQLTVFVFDYRGYGKSAGDPTEIGVLRDGRAARKWLSEHAGVKEAEILLIGRSLGGAVAVDLASKDGARGLVLESTFSSLPDVAAAHAPWIAPHWNMTQRMDSASKIVDYKGPLLQSHGDSDRLIPVELAKKLYAAAPGKKRFYLIPGKDHNDPEGESYAEALDEFIDGLPQSSP